MSSQHSIRPLGPMELWSSSRHNLGFYRSFANTCRYTLPAGALTGKDLPGTVEQALALVVLQLGGLQVAIASEDTDKAYFVHAPRIDVSEHIQWHEFPEADEKDHDAKLLRLLKEKQELLWPSVASRPPWDLIVVRSARTADQRVCLDIAFVCHHALCDGKSSTVFHSLLLEALNKSLGGEPPSELQAHILNIARPPTLAAPLGQLVDMKISWYYLISTLWGALAPAWLKPAPPPGPWTGGPVRPEPNEVNHRLVVLDAPTVAILLAACRAQGVTLTPFLQALILASLSRHLPETDTTNGVLTNNVISLLPYATQPAALSLDLNRALSVAYTGHEFRFSGETVDGLRRAAHGGTSDEKEEETKLIWAAARELGASLKGRLRTLPHDDIAGMTGWISNFQEFWLKKVGQPRSTTWSLSNLGSMKMGSAGEAGGEAAWRLERSIFTQPVEVAGAAFNVCVSGVNGGQLCIIVGWQEGIVPATLMESLAADLQAWCAHFR